MFLDTSAVVAILLAETGWEKLVKQLQLTSQRITGAHVRLETSIILAARLNVGMSKAEEFYDEFLDENEIEVLDVSDETAHHAVMAYQKFGKGQGHKAKLNFADCLSYACAKQRDIPLLYIGNDFAHTDIRKA